jgi:hypothetical protein
VEPGVLDAVQRRRTGMPMRVDLLPVRIKGFTPAVHPMTGHGNRGGAQRRIAAKADHSIFQRMH